MELLSIYDCIGFVGVAVLIYALTKLNIISGYAGRYEFYWCNALGSGLLLFSDVYRGSWFSVGVGLFWIVISLLTILNKLQLPNKALMATTVVALTFFGCGFVNAILAVQPLQEAIFTCLGMVSTAAAVVVYGMLASGRLGLMSYLLIGIAAKAVMMTALLNGFNLASFSLQGYSISIACVGVYREIQQRYENQETA